MSSLSIGRTPAEVQWAHQQFMWDVESSPWRRLAIRLLECETLSIVLHDDGRIERGPYSAALQNALDRHAEHVRELARRHGFEVAD